MDLLVLNFRPYMNFQSLQHVSRAVNKIRNNSLNDSLFNQLCVDNDKDFNRMIFHTEVRWLSNEIV